jgi:hypothetical protein
MQFTDQKQNIKQILTKWQNLSSSLDGFDTKRNTIEYILPFIQLASLLNAIQKDEELTTLLNNFRSFYKNICPLPLEKGSSYLKKELLQQLQNIDEIKDIRLITEELIKMRGAYPHAHVVTSFYFGDLFEKQASALEKQENFESFIKQAQEKLATILATKNLADCDFDSYEEHVLLNQKTDFNQRLKIAGEIIYNKDSTERFLKKIDPAIVGRHAGRSVKVFFSGENGADSEKVGGDKNLKTQAGVEVEISFRDEEFSLQTIWQKIATAKKLLSEINNAEKFRQFYKDVRGNSGSNFKQIDVSAFIAKLQQCEFAEIRSENTSLNPRTFELINDIIQKSLPEKDAAEIRKTIAKMSREEAFAFLLLFSNQDIATDLRFNFDGFDRDVGQVYELIKQDKFYSQIVDMLYALETDIFLGDVDDEKVKQLTKKWQELVYWSNFVGLDLDKANQQTNFSFAIDDVDLVGYRVNEDGKGATISRLGVEILKAIQQAVQETNSRLSILRDQTEIDIAFDAKKSGNEKFFKHALTQKTAENPDLTEFAMHKLVAAKNATIRISKVNDSTIVEIRLAGVNSHNPGGEEGKLDFGMAEELIKAVDQAVQKYVKSLTENYYRALLGERVNITDGKISSELLPPIEVRQQKKKSETNLRHDPKFATAIQLATPKFAIR